MEILFTIYAPIRSAKITVDSFVLSFLNKFEHVALIALGQLEIGVYHFNFLRVLGLLNPFFDLFQLRNFTVYANVVIAGFATLGVYSCSYCLAFTTREVLFLPRRFMFDFVVLGAHKNDLSWAGLLCGPLFQLTLLAKDTKVIFASYTTLDISFITEHVTLSAFESSSLSFRH